MFWFAYYLFSNKVKGGALKIGMPDHASRVAQLLLLLDGVLCCIVFTFSPITTKVVQIQGSKQQGQVEILVLLSYPFAYTNL